MQGWDALPVCSKTFPFGGLAALSIRDRSRHRRTAQCVQNFTCRAIIDTVSLSVPQAREKMGREAKEDVEMEDDHDDVDLGADEESSVCLSVGFGA